LLDVSPASIYSKGTYQELNFMTQFANPVAVQLEPDLAAALSLKAEQLHRTVSELVNQAVRVALEEDPSDLAALEERAAEPAITLEELLQDLKSHGKL
jgi:predicted transcriptional regulator